MSKLKKKEDAIRDEIVEMEKLLRITEPTDDEYDQTIAKLERLYALRDKKKCKTKVDPNTIAMIMGGLVEIGLIMSYEQLHVISTKAFTRVIRPRF